MANKIKIHESTDFKLPAELGIKLQESEESKELPDKITTVVEAIHSGLTRNFTFYPSDNLEKSTNSWTQPYEKPVIKNHDINEEPNGRVKQATFKQSNISPDSYTIELELEITDADTIRKVMDGRYQTLSIGGNTTSAVCSICAVDLVKEGYCGHQKGRTYEGKQAYWIIGEMDFDEISWVNVPADRSAQVIQKNATPVTTEPEMAGFADNKGGNNMPDLTQTADILEQIDALAQTSITEDAAPDEEPEVTPAAEPAAAPESTEPDAEPAAAADEPSGEPGIEEQLAEAVGQLASLKEENTNLVVERDGLQESVDTLTAEKTALTERVAELETQLATADEEIAGNVKQNSQLASYTHKVLAESVVNLELVLGNIEESAVESTLAGLTKETSRSLSEKAKALAATKPQRIVQTIDNPLHAGTDGLTPEGTTVIKDELDLNAYAAKFSKAFTKSYRSTN